MVDVVLVVFVDLVLLDCEVVRLKRYFELVRGFWRSLEVGIFALVDGGDKIEGASLAILFSAAALAR